MLYINEMPIMKKNEDKESRCQRIRNALFEFDMAFGKPSGAVYDDIYISKRIELWDKYTNQLSDIFFDSMVETCLRTLRRYPTLGEFQNARLSSDVERRYIQEFDECKKNCKIQREKEEEEKKLQKESQTKEEAIEIIKESSLLSRLWQWFLAVS